jgi:3-phosphoshikimate 1-carboxyvinyltransferase
LVLPEKLEIIPLEKPPSATVRVPGSKSITNRALVLAALAGRGNGCELFNALRSEDTEIMVRSLRQLGFQVDEGEDWATQPVCVRNPHTSRIIPAHRAELFVGNSGTTMRFLTAMVCLGEGEYGLDGTPRMRQRPIGDLATALNALEGCVLTEEGFPPVRVRANRLFGGAVGIKGDVSSQFLSGLLMAAAMAENAVTIVLDGPLVSQPYVGMTLAMMRDFGARVDSNGMSRFTIPGGQQYCGRRYRVEPDASAASYYFAAAGILSGCVTVAGMALQSIQGDVRFVELLRQMGCSVEKRENSVMVQGGPLHGIDADMNDISDTVMTLAAVACFAEGPTTIRNVAHIRRKESDRIAALATELRRVGAEVEEYPDGLKITPRPLHGAEIETYNDHRMAMSMSLIGLKVPGIVIKTPGCVAKTYPGFFAELEKLR